VTLAAVKQAQHAEIRRRYRKRKKHRTAPQLASLRLADLAKLFRARYGLKLPDDDAGRDDLQVALSHLAALSTARDRMARYVELWAPWLTVAAARAAIDTALTEPKKWRADQLAWRMRLTAADRATLGITTIGAIDLPKAAREKLRTRKKRDRERARRKRAKAACPP
jgi:hypothetical protein